MRPHVLQMGGGQKKIGVVSYTLRCWLPNRLPTRWADAEPDGGVGLRCPSQLEEHIVYTANRWAVIRFAEAISRHANIVSLRSAFDPGIFNSRIIRFWKGSDRLLIRKWSDRDHRTYRRDSTPGFWHAAGVAIRACPRPRLEFSDAPWIGSCPEESPPCVRRRVSLLSRWMSTRRSSRRQISP